MQAAQNSIRHKPLRRRKSLENNTQIKTHNKTDSEALELEAADEMKPPRSIFAKRRR